MEKYIRNFEMISASELHLVGEKNLAIGEMFQQLHREGILIPDGFAILTNAFEETLAENHVLGKLKNILAHLDTNTFSNLQTIGRKARQLILDCSLSYPLQVTILAAYEQLLDREMPSISLAIRPSTTLKNGGEGTFVRQQNSYLHISGPNHLLESCLHCYASLFTNRAIKYRVQQGIDHMDVLLSIGVQRMVRSDLACSGLAFNLESKNEREKRIVIKSSWGLGKNIVSGHIEPDEFVLLSSKNNEVSLLAKRLGSKLFTLRCNDKQDQFSTTTENQRTPMALQQQMSLSDEEAKMLARWSNIIEKRYSRPLSFEWAKDGINRQLYLIQTSSEKPYLNQKEEPYRIHFQEEELL